MPGVLSYLHRHEWYKHGSCYSDSPEVYFTHALALIHQINASAVRDFFARNIGKTVTVREIREKFDEAFGKGSGEKVTLKCKDGLITQLQIHLKGRLSEQAPINNLLKDASDTKTDCSKGLVDAVGF